MEGEAREQSGDDGIAPSSSPSAKALAHEREQSLGHSPETLPARRGLLRAAANLLPPASVSWAFVVSRALFLMSYVLTVVLWENVHSETDVPWPPASRVVSLIRSALFNADSGWYHSIAVSGYLKAPFDSVARQANWTFFPLWPLVVRCVGSNLWLAIGLAHLCAILALGICYHALAGAGERERARRAMVLLAFFPVSYSIAAYRPEGLFLLLTAAAYLASVKGRFWLAGALGALAALTRPQGIVVLVPLALEYARQRGRRLRSDALFLLLPPIGLGAFTWYLWHITGHPMAWAATQIRGWGHEVSSPWAVLWDNVVRSPHLVGHYGWDFTVVSIVVWLSAAAACGWLLWRRHWTLGAYSTSLLLLPLFGGTLAGTHRYVLVNFGVFLVWAGREGARDRYEIMLAVFAFLQGAFAAWMALGVHAAY